MAKLKPNEKRVQLSFLRPDDLRLFAFMEKRAYECRWDLPTFIIASLQEAFSGQIDDAEVTALAEEAARKVRERAAIPPQEATPASQVPVPTLPVAPVSMSMDDAYEQAQREIAALNAQALRSVSPGKGAPSLPMSPPKVPSSKPTTSKVQKLSRKKSGA